MVNLHVATDSKIQVLIYDLNGKLVQTALNEYKEAGDYQFEVSLSGLPSGRYFAAALADGAVMQTLKLVKLNG